MSRNALLQNWLKKTLNTEAFKCLPLAGDASFRKYSRVLLNDRSYILMDAPPPETPATFVQVAEILQSQDIHVPKISAFDLENGFLLLSDFGDRLYLEELNTDTATHLYEDAMQALLKIQQCEGSLVPAFDKVYLNKQFSVFKDWYLEKHLGWVLDAKTMQTIDLLLEKLYQVHKEQPSVFVHQDYHSRNLMVLEKASFLQKGPGILDFQDAVKGPITYDLVSLFQDGYISWPRDAVEKWVGEYQKKAENFGILTQKISPSEFLRWMDLTGLQRHLKNLGIFARLHHRDGKKQYLNDMPRLQSYIRETAERYEELRDYRSFLRNVVSSKEGQICAP